MSVAPPASPSSTAASDPRPGPVQSPAASVLDASCRVPVLCLVANAMVWLILGLALALIASIQSHGPGFLADSPWLTLGRVRPASVNALLYGFATQAALALMIWMMTRLGRQPLLGRELIFLGAVIWNVALACGLIAILAGHASGFPWLELPRRVVYFLFLGYALIGIWTAVTFHHRRERTLYVSQWYLIAALFWFPWIYSAANYLLLINPVRGVTQAVVNAWYKNNLLQLWLVPVGLATVYYFIPKLLGRPLHNRSLALFGFWTHALFGSWTGLTMLIGSPLPSWMISVSISASMVMLVPLLSVCLNWHLTLKGAYERVRGNRALAFVLFGAVCYGVAGIEAIALSSRTVSRITQFTFVPVACTHLLLLGFVAMVFFGALHDMLPRLLGVAWPSERLVQTHFWCSAAGVVLHVASLTMGGLVQGFKLNNPSIDFVSTVKAAIPFLGLSTLALLVLLAGQLAWLAQGVLLLRRHFQLAGPGACCRGLRLLAAWAKEVRA